MPSSRLIWQVSLTFIVSIMLLPRSPIYVREPGYADPASGRAEIAASKASS